jgi:cytochrome c heme-lyase
MGAAQGKPASSSSSSSPASAPTAPPPGATTSEIPCAGGRAAAAAGAAGANPMADASCPVPEEYRGVHGVFNVYNQKIDPRNNMPVAASQSMAPGQRRKISTERQRSTIPKSGVSSAEASTWTYPSPQMFYNSLVRKGKANDCTEDDMESVVSVHNAMNEDTWRRVVAWERLHVHECRDPMLLRFLGRPDDLSPLAWARYLTGGGKPFDRHDWYVDRCGQQVRYVIDYYFHEDKAGTPGQFDLVVRPAADSVGAAADRVKMAIYVGCAMLGVPCPISGNNGEIGREASAANTTAPER